MASLWEPGRCLAGGKSDRKSRDVMPFVCRVGYRRATRECEHPTAYCITSIDIRLGLALARLVPAYAGGHLPRDGAPTSHALHNGSEEERDGFVSLPSHANPTPIATMPPKALELRLLPSPQARSVGINIHSPNMYNVAILATTAEHHLTSSPAPLPPRRRPALSGIFRSQPPSSPVAPFRCRL